MLRPGGPAALAHQLLEAPLAAEAGEKERLDRRPPEAREVGDLVEGIGVDAAAFQVFRPLAFSADEFRQHDGATLAQVLQEPHHELLQRPKPQAPEGLDFVLQTAEKERQQAVDGGRIHGGGKGAGLLNRGAEAGAVAEFDRYFPAQSVGYIAQ